MVDVAQLAEHRVVAAGVESSNLSVHPTYIGVSHSGDCTGLQNRRAQAPRRFESYCPCQKNEKKEEREWKKNLNIKKNMVG